MKKVLLVFTGGTIGSTTLNSTISTDKNNAFKLLNLFERSYPDFKQVSFNSIQPIQLLSENLVPPIWELLITAIEAENISQYDGIIVTHGSDTLAYTAAVFSLYFHSIGIPLLLVCSDHPLDHPLANGLSNFIAAIEFIKNRTETGVFVPYKNPNSPVTQIHLGSRLASSLQLGSHFMSVQSNAYLNFEKNKFYLLNNTLPKNTPIRLKPKLSTRILLIRPYPGLDYSHVTFNQVNVVLHDLYHSGTACSARNLKDSYSLLKFIERCNQNNIALYMAPAIKNEDQYDGVNELIKQGVFMIWNMSLESAYAKLLLAYGSFDKIHFIHQFLKQTIAYEHIA